MIRLAIRGISEEQERQVAVRLHNVDVVSLPHLRRTDPPAHCDAVAFCGSEIATRTLIRNCLTGGMHVLYAAEQCLSADDVEILSRTAETCGLQFRLINPDRFLPSRQLIRSQIDSGRFGSIGLVRSHRWESAECRPHLEQELPSALIRDLDLTSWYFSAAPEVVYAVSTSDRFAAGLAEEPALQNADTSEFIQVHLGFADGGMALLDYSNQLPSGAGYQFLSVIGASGVAYCDDQRNKQLLFHGGAPQGIVCDEGSRGLADLVQWFVNSLRTGDPTAATATDWSAAFDLAKTVRASLESRCSITPRGVTL